MKVCSTDLPEFLVVEPEVFQDERGFFLETYHARKYAEAGIPAVFVQDNHSRSRRNTLRGLHAQARHPQGKLVRVIQGEIFDVAVDIRPPLCYIRALGRRAAVRPEFPPSLCAARLCPRLLRTE